jgi:FtsP/CotA-like multicopper oxidase with cupredoxin domain
MDLYVQQGPKRARATRSLGFVLQQGATPPAPDSVVIPGSMLVLMRNQPTDITVHNNLKEAVSIHWHGLELESYSDGVTGWSGNAEHPAPHVQPGSTFVAHLSMPRAGTFIYHTHVRDLDQLVSGLYGPIVVMEPGNLFDPRTDHVHMVGWDASSEKDLHALVNGDSVTSPPIAIKLGETHRFRFINLGAAEPADFCLKLNGAFAEWRAVAKDGADLPASQRVISKAELSIDVGETYDFEFTPTRPGVYVLDTPTGPKGQRWSRRIIVN